MLSPGYAEEIKRDLFSIKTISELKGVAEKYRSKVPDSLTSQFQDRPNKYDAVKRYRDRQKREETQLHPLGEMFAPTCYGHFMVLSNCAHGSAFPNHILASLGVSKHFCCCILKIGFYHSHFVRGHTINFILTCGYF